MKIKNDYEGASIDIIKIIDNKAYLSLRKEKDKYSFYYNFFIKNDSNKEALVYIDNFSNSQYFCDNRINMPFLKTDNSNWQRLDKKLFSIDGGSAIIRISPNFEGEISSSPRYGFKEFIKFANNCNLKFQHDDMIKIVLGNERNPVNVIIARQHPGETLSSFFLEGIISEILENKFLLEKYCFVIFPLVNIEGIKQGNHRYYNGKDFNRCWKNNEVSEIKYIKSAISEYNINDFIDIHNDELTNFSYIRTNKKINNDVGFTVLSDMNKITRFIRGIVKNKKIINVFSYTAREYIIKKYHCRGILIELSLFNEDFNKLNEKGRKLIKSLYNYNK